MNNKYKTRCLYDFGGGRVEEITKANAKEVRKVAEKRMSAMLYRLKCLQNVCEATCLDS